ncbi:MAG TPA: hypothetical protein VMU94_10680 [Streptosporangiaceae bacterium]|nr:hypothetical protein [Streptosporangiaceae bacterium]
MLGNAIGAAAEPSLTRKLGSDGSHARELIRDHMTKATQIAARFPRLPAASVRHRRDTAPLPRAASKSSTAWTLISAPTSRGIPAPVGRRI